MRAKARYQFWLGAGLNDRLHAMFINVLDFSSCGNIKMDDGALSRRWGSVRVDTMGASPLFVFQARDKNNTLVTLVDNGVTIGKL